MSAEFDPLKTTLDRLHEQLASLDKLDAEQRAQLATALGEIQSALGEKRPVRNESTMRRLGEIAGQLESNHPALATSIGSLINTLANSGI